MFLINFICEKKRIFIDPLNENKNLFNQTKSIEYSFFWIQRSGIRKSKSFFICVIAIIAETHINFYLGLMQVMCLVFAS